MGEAEGKMGSHHGRKPKAKLDEEDQGGLVKESTTRPERKGVP